MKTETESHYIYLQVGDYTQPRDEVLVKQEWQTVRRPGYKLSEFNPPHRRKVETTEVGKLAVVTNSSKPLRWLPLDPS